MAYETIRVEQNGAIRTIVLDRPDKLNACPPHMADEIFEATGDLGDTRAVLITGAGRAFCSGADLAASAGGPAMAGERSYGALSRSHNPLIQRLATLPVPLIAAVNGAAAGIGCSIALTADFVVAAKSAYFLQAFVNIGLVPDGGASWMLPRLIGTARAAQMMMLGERVGGEEAHAIGLIYKCVADDALADEAQALAERLAAGPTVALGLMRRTMRQGLESDLATTLRLEAEAQRQAGNSQDAKEGVMAFLQKRPPDFTGA